MPPSMTTGGFRPVKEGIRSMARNKRDETGPIVADLATTEAEWPLMDADLAVVNAAIRLLPAVGGPSPLDWRRLRRARRRVLSARLRLAAPVPADVAAGGAS